MYICMIHIHTEYFILIYLKNFFIFNYKKCFRQKLLVLSYKTCRFTQEKVSSPSLILIKLDRFIGKIKILNKILNIFLLATKHIIKQ